MLSELPVTRFRGFLKAISIDHMPAEVRIQMQVLFPRFFEQAVLSEHNRNLRELSGNVAGVHASGHLRRFSGELFGLAPLPRRRYAAVCSDTGADDETLIRELFAYTDWSASGVFAIVDLAYPEVAAEFEYTQPRFELAVVWPYNGGRQSNVIPQFQLDNALFIPYAVTAATIDDAVDLRFPETRDAFAKY